MVNSRALAIWSGLLLVSCDGSNAAREREEALDGGDTSAADGDADAMDDADGGSSRRGPDTSTGELADADGDGWDGVVPEPGAVRFNEVDCDGDRVELVNAGSETEDLTRFVVTDDLTQTARAQALTGTLEPGAYSVVTLTAFGLKCGEENLFLVRDAVLVDVGQAAPVPGGATWGRLPDTSGEFAANTPTLGAANELWVDLSVALFAPFDPAVQIALVVDAASTDALALDPRAYVRATVTLTAAGKTVGPIEIGVRLKGSLGSFRTLSGKAAFKLDADRFVPGQSFFGLTKLTLNNLVQDPSSIHEWLGYRMFAAAGVPVPRVGFAQVTLNGAAYGSYLLLEDTTASAYLRTQFASTAALYEPPAGVDVFPEQLTTYDVKQGDPRDFSALLAIAEPLADGARESWFDAVGTKIDWPEVLRLQAVDIVNGNGDGYAYARNNYMLHVDAGGTLRMLPWGIDSSFMAQLDFFRTDAQILSRCFQDARCAELWLSALEHVHASSTALLTPELLEQARALGRLNTERFAGDPRWEHEALGIGQAVESTLDRLQGNLTHLKNRIDCQRSTGVDLDGDGRRCELDCNDDDPTIYRGAPETCGDRIDQDCSGVADDGDTCPACVQHPSNGALLVCPRAMTLATLTATCQAQSAAPLTIADGGENAALTADLDAWFSESSLFIGLSDSAVADTFAWTSGDASSYRNFVDGFPFPRNFGQGPRCAVMSSSGTWRTEQCDTRVPGACER